MSKRENNQADTNTEGTMNDPAADGARGARMDNRIAEQAEIITRRENLTADQATHLRNTMSDAATYAERDCYDGYDAAIEAAVDWLRS